MKYYVYFISDNSLNDKEYPDIIIAATDKVIIEQTRIQAKTVIENFLSTPGYQSEKLFTRSIESVNA